MNVRRIAAAAVALCALGLGTALASPLKTRTLGAKAQEVKMCPNCKEKIVCAKAGDYTIAFSADVDNPKLGTGRVAVHVRDRNGKPVDNAAVVAKLTMPEHGHANKPLTLRSSGHGRYQAPTHLVMPGAWRADVEVTPEGGDTVKQAFSFSR